MKELSEMTRPCSKHLISVSAVVDDSSQAQMHADNVPPKEHDCSLSILCPVPSKPCKQEPEGQAGECP